MANTTKKTTASDTDVVEAKETETKPIIPKEIDPNQMIVVRNGFQGKLVYRSQRTNETFRWEAFGDEQEMELRELRNAKSASKKFFINNWFMFDSENEWVIDYLGLGQYYKHAIKLDEFDDLFDKPAAEITSIVSKLSVGQKKSVAYRARQLVVDGQIDSHKAIKALEHALGIELIEK